MSETADGTVLIFPSDKHCIVSLNFCGMWNNTNQVAAVTRGMRLSGVILLSSMDCLDKWPAVSSHSREWAVTVEISTSPPKYRERSQK